MRRGVKVPPKDSAPATRGAAAQLSTVAPAAAGADGDASATAAHAPKPTKVSMGHGGHKLSLETGRLANMANGSVFAQHGDTVVLATVVADSSVDAGADFMPLQVEYREKTFASGRIPNTFVRREMGASDKEILGARVIDRTLRPLFPAGFFNETQVIATVMSYDPACDAEVLSINAASAALSVSDLPWAGPAGAVRVGWLDGQPVLNPSQTQLEQSKLNLLYAGANDRALMIEVGANQLPEADLVAALRFAHAAAMDVIEVQVQLAQQAGRPKRNYKTKVTADKVIRYARRQYLDEARAMFAASHDTKEGRAGAMGRFMGRVRDGLQAQFPWLHDSRAGLVADMLCEEALRNVILDAAAPAAGGNGASSAPARLRSAAVPGLVATGPVRPDGRNSTQVRDLYCETSILPRTHGSSMFKRGGTSAVCTATLGPPEMAQTLRSVAGGPVTKHMFLHYEFPPYSVNEVGKVGGINRRMVGHGALAEKAVAAVFPSVDKYPHVVRLTSEITSSDGSSSMATVCGASLALMDAGVPVVAPVAGISVGLVTPPRPLVSDGGDGDDAEEAAASGSDEGGGDTGADTSALAERSYDPDTYVLLTDILGMEDHFLDMDFKVAGTLAGVTAVQLDIKLDGVPLHVLEEAIGQAREARLSILEVMATELAEPRERPKRHAPRLERLVIPPESRGRVIGAGGETIRAIEADTGTAIRVEDGENAVRVWAADEASFNAARERIAQLAEPEVKLKVGRKYKAVVLEIRDFGAILDAVTDDGEVLGGGIVHISELAHTRTAKVTDVLEEGQTIEVQAIDVDAVGRAKFSLRALKQVRPGQAGWGTVAAAQAQAARARAEAEDAGRGKGGAGRGASKVSAATTHKDWKWSAAKALAGTATEDLPPVVDDLDVRYGLTTNGSSSGDEGFSVGVDTDGEGTDDDVAAVSAMDFTLDVAEASYDDTFASSPGSSARATRGKGGDQPSSTLRSLIDASAQLPAVKASKKRRKNGRRRASEAAATVQSISDATSVGVTGAPKVSVGSDPVPSPSVAGRRKKAAGTKGGAAPGKPGRGSSAKPAAAKGKAGSPKAKGKGRATMPSPFATKAAGAGRVTKSPRGVRAASRGGPDAGEAGAGADGGAEWASVGSVFKYLGRS